MTLPAVFRQRRLWFKIHGTLGLLAGVLLALIGLTGALGVYGGAIDAFLNPGLSGLNPGTPLPLERHYATLKEHYPDHTGSWTLNLPKSEGEALIAIAEKPRLTQNLSFRPLMVGLDPATSKIISTREKGWTLRTFLVRLHASFLAGRWGKNLVGVLGIALLFSSFMGLGLWITQRRPLAERFRLERHKGMLVFLSDLHHLMGIFLAPVLLGLALTGIALVFPSVPETLLGAKDLSHGDAGKPIQSTGSQAHGAPIQLDAAILLARGPFPHAEVRGVTTPEGPNGSIQVHFKQAQESSDRHPLTAVWIDAYSGQILEVLNPLRMGAGQRLETLIWPIHTGEWAGGSWRLLWLITGLSLPVFFATGLLRWLIRTHRLEDRPVVLKAILPWIRDMTSKAYQRLRGALP